MTESAMNETLQRAKELFAKMVDDRKQLRECLEQIGHDNGKAWAEQGVDNYLVDDVANYHHNYVKWFLFDTQESRDIYDKGLILDGDYEDHPLYQALVRDLPKEVIDKGALYENGDALIEGFVSGAWEVRHEHEEKELSDMGHPVA